MNINGCLIMKTLKAMEKPPTIANIVDYIAEAANVEAEEVKGSVLDTLNAGVRYGYLQEKDGKYYVHLECGGEEVREDSTSDDGSMEERSRRSRRKRRRSKQGGRRSGSSRRRRRQ